jgi:hypothetical protein
MATAMMPGAIGLPPRPFFWQDGAMSAIRFPIAANAEAALARPIGRAARAREAALIAGAEVAFASDMVGPAFASREAALDAFGGRLDDPRPGRAVSVQPEDRYCDLRELAAGPPPNPGSTTPTRPVYRDGRRWPAPRAAPATIWRLSISYWRTAAAEALLEPPPTEPPRRGGARHPPPDARALRERVDQPLRPVKPQQPLDIGLFEVRPPEAPHILMPDE